MDLEDSRGQPTEEATEDGDSGRLSSESEVLNLKQLGTSLMSRLHDIAICPHCLYNPDHGWGRRWTSTRGFDHHLGINETS